MEPGQRSAAFRVEAGRKHLLLPKSVLTTGQDLQTLLKSTSKPKKIEGKFLELSLSLSVLEVHGSN